MIPPNTGEPASERGETLAGVEDPDREFLNLLKPIP